MGTISLTLHDSLDSLAAMEEASSCSYLGGALECSSFFASGEKKFRNLSFMLQCIATCKNDWCVKQRQHLYKS